MNSWIYISTNSGYAMESAQRVPQLLDFRRPSADGVKLAAVAATTNWIYTSTDGGTTWKSNQVTTDAIGFRAVTSSADGLTLAGDQGSPRFYLNEFGINLGSRTVY